MLEIRPSNYAQSDSPEFRAVYDSIWDQIDPVKEAPPAAYQRLLRLPWIEPRVVCAAAAISAPLYRRAQPRFSWKENHEQKLASAERFFVSALLGVVAGIRGGDRIGDWLWQDMPGDQTRELFVGETREAIRAMVRRQGYISAPGVRFGTMYRKSGSTWEHRSGRGAPVMPNNPFSTGVNAGKAPF